VLQILLRIIIIVIKLFIARFTASQSQSSVNFQPLVTQTCSVFW